MTEFLKLTPEAAKRMHDRGVWERPFQFTDPIPMKRSPDSTETHDSFEVREDKRGEHLAELAADQGVVGFTPLKQQEIETTRAFGFSPCPGCLKPSYVHPAMAPHAFLCENPQCQVFLFLPSPRA